MTSRANNSFETFYKHFNPIAEKYTKYSIYTLMEDKNTELAEKTENAETRQNEYFDMAQTARTLLHASF